MEQSIRLIQQSRYRELWYLYLTFWKRILFRRTLLFLFRPLFFDHASAYLPKPLGTSSYSHQANKCGGYSFCIEKFVLIRVFIRYLDSFNIRVVSYGKVFLAYWNLRPVFYPTDCVLAYGFVYCFLNVLAIFNRTYLLRDSFPCIQLGMRWICYILYITTILLRSGISTFDHS